MMPFNTAMQQTPKASKKIGVKRGKPMKATDGLALLVCVMAISAGQILFKFAAIRSLTPGKSLFDLATSPPLLAGAAIYAAATLLWIWLLRSTPLSVAYPFMAASFVIVPIASSVFFGESLTAARIIGAAAIAVGIIVSVL